MLHPDAKYKVAHSGAPAQPQALETFILKTEVLPRAAGAAGIWRTPARSPTSLWQGPQRKGDPPMARKESW